MFFYDEVRMISSFDVKAENDILYPHMLNHKVDTENMVGQKTGPKHTTWDITANEYREFMSTFSYSLNRMKNWLN